MQQELSGDFKASDHELNLEGLICPEPVMRLRARIREMKAGATIWVSATDPTTQRDIAQFCHYLGHELLEQKTVANRFFYFIRKRPESA